MSIYYLFIGIAGFVGSFVFAYESKKNRVDSWQAIKISAVFLVFSLIGGKLFHILFESAGHVLSDGQIAGNMWDLLKDDPWHGFRFLDPGYVLYGAIFGAICVIASIAKQSPRVKSKRLPRRKLLAMTISNHQLSLPLAKAFCISIFIGRIGCFFTGCCYGIGAIPVQLFEAFFVLILFFRVESFEYFITRYAMGRFGLEFLRADSSRGFWFFNLSTSQWISLFILLFWGLAALTGSLKSSQMQKIRTYIYDLCHYRSRWRATSRLSRRKN